MVLKHDDNQGGVLAVVLGLVGVVVALVISVATQQIDPRAEVLAPAAASTRPALALTLAVPAPMAAPASNALDEGGTSVIVQNGVVKFYFAPNQSALAAGGRDALTQIVQAVAGGKKAVVSGFHDSTGNAARNVELARQRALAVRHALNALGVSNSQIELNKPAQMPGSGSNAEARRVEITVE